MPRSRTWPRHEAGFTLLETILAMSLMMLLLGMGVIFQFNSQDKVILRKAASKIETMASRGHAMAILHQKPFWLRFEEGMVVLAGADVKTPVADGEGTEEFAWDDPEAAASLEVIYDEYATKALVSLHRWGTDDDDWLEAGEDRVLTWQFQSTGLCEPVGIRVELEGSWIVMHMHPLTARVEEEEMMIE